MKKSTSILRGLNDVRASYILDSELSAEKLAASDAPVRGGSKARYIRILAVAATVAALTAVAVIGAGIMKQSGENPPAVPPVGETADITQTPTTGENETAAPMDGSYSTDLYTVEEIDGKHYINFVDGNKVPEGGSSGGNNMIIISGLQFSSVEVMKNKFMTGDFSTEEIQTLKSQLNLTDMGFEIFDMTNLYDAVLPEEWKISSVSLNSDHYSISFVNPGTYDEANNDIDGEYGSISFLSDERFNSDYQYYYASQFEKVKDGLLEDQTDFYGVPCQAYEYRTTVSKIKSVFLNLEYNGCSFEVLMNYCMEHQNEEMVNQAIPYIVHMYGELNGQKFKITLSGFEKVFDADFLKSFSIQPYITDDQ